MSPKHSTRTVTFQVLDGVDKGRVFRDLPIPVSIGREEGNLLRLNDERVSRYHAKVQQEDVDVILTDLDSTNGTRVNGMPVQIRRLRPGDQISIGRSILLFGSLEEIAEARRALEDNPAGVETPRTTFAGTGMGEDLNFDLDMPVEALLDEPLPWAANEKDRPPLPNKLSPAQAARLSEIFDYLHRGVTSALENLEASEKDTSVRIGFNEWQMIQAVQLFLARYVREISDPFPDM